MSAPKSEPIADPFVAPRPNVVGVFSRGIARIDHLPVLLGAREIVFDPSDADAGRLDAVVGWGKKPNTVAPARYARRHGLPMLRLEDGFLRSVGLGVAGAPPLSMVIDDRGIYYDGGSESRLEAMLQAPTASGPLGDPALMARAREGIRRLVEAGISKYNDSPPSARFEFEDDRPRVLVVDQTAGDMSIELGGLSMDDYARILEAAVDENPDAEILVKTHPDVLAGKRRGCIPRSDLPRVRFVTMHCQPFELLRRVRKVYVGTSQLGFEALMAGCQVSVFGAPFYAGWGLTDDRREHARRSTKRSLEEVFGAAYLLYPRYRHPVFGREAEFEEVLDHLIRQRQMFGLNEGHLLCIGFSRWKRAFMGSFLRCPGNHIEHVGSCREAKSRLRDDTKVVVWGRNDLDDLDDLLDHVDRPLIRVEDGFLRSVGLGSDLVAPASLVFDRTGLYFDPNTPSDLETLLERADFDASTLKRAADLVAAIVETRVSKYVVGQDDPLDLELAPNQRVLLVPGQVESDASIRLGCVDVMTNGGLIRATREERPSAFLIYKPHPDVVSGNRKGGISDEERAMCDLVIEDRSLHQCLDVADEVHTMTSLVGFEALLRGKDVHVYGRPFYCGWGLTVDRHATPRRTQRLTLEQLVAGALISYPRYVDPDTREFTTPEVIIERLAAGRHASDGIGLRSPWLVRQAKKLLGALKEIRRDR